MVMLLMFTSLLFGDIEQAPRWSMMTHSRPCIVSVSIAARTVIKSVSVITLFQEGFLLLRIQTHKRRIYMSISVYVHVSLYNFLKIWLMALAEIGPI